MANRETAAPVTSEELLNLNSRYRRASSVQPRPNGCASEAAHKRRCHHAGGVLAEDRGRAINAKGIDSDYSVWSLRNQCPDTILLGVSSHAP